MQEQLIRDRFRGALLGLAVGDALGAPFEGRCRGTFGPVTGMVDAPEKGLRKGQWTDDTATSLCLATSLIERGGFDADDFMQRLVRWWREGYMSCTGSCYGVGPTTARALRAYSTGQRPGDARPDEEMLPSNGCIMRLAPVAMFYFPDLDLVERQAATIARLTHPLQECVDAARLFARMLCRALRGEGKEAVLCADRGVFGACGPVRNIADCGYRSKGADEIRGTLHVVDCLEAALWCFDRSDSFSEAVLMAVNLGDDTDTTAAVCGQLAGAFWGASAIPEQWLAELAWAERISEIADRLWERALDR